MPLAGRSPPRPRCRNRASNRFLPHRLSQYGNGQRWERGPYRSSRAPRAAGDIGLHHAVPLQGLQRRHLLDQHPLQPTPGLDRAHGGGTSPSAFSQQVEMAEGVRRSAAALQSPPPAVFQAPVASNRGACDALAQQVRTALGRPGAAAAIGPNAGLDSRRAAQNARLSVVTLLLTLVKNSTSQYNDRLALGDWPCCSP